MTSSPLYPKGNAEVERAVQTVKNLLKKSKDPYLALMSYRATPLQNGYSPAQLLFGRRIRTNLPQHPGYLTPELPDFDKLEQSERMYRKRQSENADRRHGARMLPTLSEGDRVWIRDKNVPATITGKAETPRSYIVETERGSSLRRNRKSLCRLSPDVSSSSQDIETQETETFQGENIARSQSNADQDQTSSDSCENTAQRPSSPKPVKTGQYITRSGRISKQPDRTDM